MGGLILDFTVSSYKGIAVFQPVINGVGGNLVAVQASRISTALHAAAPLGKLPKFSSELCINPCSAFCARGEFLIMFTVLQCDWGASQTLAAFLVLLAILLWWLRFILDLCCVFLLYLGVHMSKVTFVTHISLEDMTRLPFLCLLLCSVVWCPTPEIICSPTFCSCHGFVLSFQTGSFYPCSTYCKYCIPVQWKKTISLLLYLLPCLLPVLWNNNFLIICITKVFTGLLNIYIFLWSPRTPSWGFSNWRSVEKNKGLLLSEKIVVRGKMLPQ